MGDAWEQLDYYELLQVPRDATSDEIKKAYVQLELYLHNRESTELYVMYSNLKVVCLASIKLIQFTIREQRYYSVSRRVL